MESNVGIERKVGIFVLGGILILIIVIFALGGDRAFFRSYEKMKILLQETSGLGVGAVVQISGLPAGNVVGIDFDPETGKLAVSLKIDKRYAVKITHGSTASIRTQGALGDKFVMITPGPSNNEPLVEGGIIPSEEDSDLLSTLGKSGGQVEKVFEILERINVVSKQLEQGGFGSNIAEATKNLNHSMKNLDELLAGKRMGKALDHFGSILEKIDTGQGTLGGLINDPTVHEDLKSILGGAKRSNLLKYLIRQTIQKSEDEQEKPKK